ncbi:response regulator [Phaeodactylibacter sp.]|uniref:LytR/AlgR family response regulator transcription factor n=1 Tax=Phaeodactylibacter sp. TaxID=1940289 RepID=UPI0025F05FFE|nr:response regulator [Phaeodactylibacter sp.]MCI4651037.1 response regulator [Phaeodactylibacter sp.]MCI5094260.1 response regulator [Phaeodactylibacter sp.]
MIKILGIEDNPIHQEFLFVVIQELGYELAGLADNAKQALELLFSTKPDVVLMDIEINGQQDGIALAKRINQLRPLPIIYTTARADRATLDRAKNTLPYGYLVKPFTQQDLQAALELAIYRFAKDQQERDPVTSAPEWENGIALQQALFVKAGDMIHKVRFEDILLIEVAKDRYCTVSTAEDEYLVRSPLREIAVKLPMQDFLQVHRSAIVRASAIDRIEGSGAWLMVGNKTVTVGKTYREKLLNNLNLL